MSLNEYLSKYTSEDNQSFQELHDKDREDFMKRIYWMFAESSNYNRLNHLALTAGSNAQPKAILPNGSNELSKPMDVPAI